MELNNVYPHTRQAKLQSLNTESVMALELQDNFAYKRPKAQDTL